MTDAPITLTAFAKMRGVSTEAVSKAVRVGRLSKSVSWTKSGMPRLDPDIAAQEWESNTDSAQQRVRSVPPPRQSEPEPEPTSTGPQAATFQQARTLREAYMARLAKLEYEEKTGSLVRADAVKNEAFRIARVVRDSLLNIPDRIAGDLAAEDDQFAVHQKLTAELRKALEGLSV